MINDKEHATEPAVDHRGKTCGGFSGVAQLLNERFPHRRRPISRQLVHKWWIYRIDNEFPEAVSMTGSANGKGRPEFNYAAVIAWYRNKRQHRDEVRYARSHTPDAVLMHSASTASDTDVLAA